VKSIAVLFSGKGSNLEYLLRMLHGQVCHVAKAVTNNPQAPGITIAQRYGIEVEVIDASAYESREAFDQEIVTRLREERIDLTVLAGFMRILTPVFTEQIRAINLHPSLLPRHKGLHAIEKSYADPFDEGGVTVHWVSSELDGGEIILQKKIPKRGLSYNAYEAAIKKIEKEALAEAVQKTLINK